MKKTTLKTRIDEMFNNYGKYYNIDNVQDYLNFWHSMEVKLYYYNPVVSIKEKIKLMEKTKENYKNVKQTEKLKEEYIDKKIGKYQEKKYLEFIYKTTFDKKEEEKEEIIEVLEEETQEIPSFREFDKMVYSRLSNLSDFRNVALEIDEIVKKSLAIDPQEENSIRNYFIDKYADKNNGFFDVDDMVIIAYLAFKRIVAGKCKQYTVKEREVYYNKYINKNKDIILEDVERTENSIANIYSSLEYFTLSEIFNLETFNIIYNYCIKYLAKIKKAIKENKTIKDKKGRVYPTIFYNTTENYNVDIQYRRLVVTISYNCLGDIYHNIMGIKRGNSKRVGECIYTENFTEKYIKSVMQYEEMEFWRIMKHYMKN